MSSKPLNVAESQTSSRIEDRPGEPLITEVNGVEGNGTRKRHGERERGRESVEIGDSQADLVHESLAALPLPVSTGGHFANDTSDQELLAKPVSSRDWARRLEIKARIRPATIQPFPKLSAPLFPKLSAKLTNLMSIVPSHWRWLPFWLYVMSWIIIAAILILFNNYKATTIQGTPSYIDCTTQLWAWNAEICGADGVYCKPFANQSFVVRCPSLCHLTYNQNKRWLGPSQVGFMRPWVVGTGVYRAESWICPSAIHAGLVSKNLGGCAVVEIVGEATDYPSTTANGVTSLAFDSRFPKSYRLKPADSSHCTDFSWGILPIAIILVALFPLVRPSKGAFYFALVSAGFWHVIFIGIPIHDESWTAAAWGTYFVTLGFAYFLYKVIIRDTIPSPPHFPIDTFLFSTLPFYLALHMEILTAPLANFGLTSRAFREPTTLIVFVIAVPAVVILCLFQLWLLRRHGVLGSYLLGYGLAIIAYFLLPLVLFLHVHLHHYTLGLILLPLTRFVQTRPTLLIQGFLLGLVVQGLARWGPASPFDTSFQNLNGDEAVWIPRPEFTIDPAGLAANGTVNWSFGMDSLSTIPDGLPYDSFSLLLNDVEVYRGAESKFNLKTIKADSNPTRPYYVRVAFVQSGSALEYSYPVIVRGNGTVTYQNGTVVSL
ncbi:hypothetical protein SpCBS45565_g03956 [Spizellomyces sp. 'palustris']|nr:hypothetical protein SpCBS45565_g03956 [Spizellomyces sp. 'palustris']